MFIQDTPQVQEKRERLRLVAPTSRIPNQWEMPSPPFSDTYHLAPAATRDRLWCNATYVQVRRNGIRLILSTDIFAHSLHELALALFDEKMCA